MVNSPPSDPTRTEEGEPAASTPWTPAAPHPAGASPRGHPRTHPPHDAHHGGDGMTLAAFPRRRLGARRLRYKQYTPPTDRRPARASPDVRPKGLGGCL